MPSKWNYTQVETALCLYEAMDQAYDDHQDVTTKEPRADAPQWFKDLAETWENNGSYGMKHIAAHLAFEVEKVWKKLGGKKADLLMDAISFDCEFIPEVLPLVDWLAIDHNQIGKLKPEALATLTAWRDSKLQPKEPEIEILYDVGEFTRRANAHGEKRWFLPDMMADVFEADRQVAEAIAAGETPEEFIDKIAADLDLHDFTY